LPHAQVCLKEKGGKIRGKKKGRAGGLTQRKGGLSKGRQKTADR